MYVYTIIYKDLLYYLYICISNSNIINEYDMFVILNGISIQGVCVHNSQKRSSYICVNLFNISGEINRMLLHAVIVFN